MHFPEDWIPTILTTILGNLTGFFLSWFTQRRASKELRKTEMRKEKIIGLNTLLSDVNDTDRSLYALRLADEKKGYSKESIDANIEISREYKEVVYKFTNLKFDFIKMGYPPDNSNTKFNLSNELNYTYYVDPRDEETPEAKKKKEERELVEKTNKQALDILNNKYTNKNKEKVIIELIDQLIASLSYYYTRKGDRNSKYMIEVTDLNNIVIIEKYFGKLEKAITLYVAIEMKNITDH